MSAIWIVVLFVAGPIATFWIWCRGWTKDTSFRVPPLLAVGLWVGWGCWEQFVVQPGDNIRVDLVLFLPILLAATFAAGIAIKQELA